MNSRFKFRVWDNINKRYDTDLSLIDKDGDLCYQDGCKYCNGEHPEDFTIEQCTGLKDKNGKLIYEGDVICRDNGRWKEIRFYQGGFGWWTEYYDFVCFSGHRHLEEILQTHEVIGNIHEDQFRETTKLMESEVSDEE